MTREPRLAAQVAGLLVAAIALSITLPCLAASPVRYALIVGNNQGKAPDGSSPPDLRHAEREAGKLHDALVQHGGFSEDRTAVVRGRGRAEILAAARGLAERLRRDRQGWGDVSTIFAFFFTGHGVEGKLLTADAPLTGSDLAGVFRDMGATLTFGMFDACSSGSLDIDALRAKGLAVTGFNAFAELPREVINARGTMWVVSSGPGEVSYEDDKLGGVFTHYFIEGMQRAKADDFGISLDTIWEYASRMTHRHTSMAGRPQTPQKLVRELTVAGPVYFSFPRPRSAELGFMPDVAGTFLLRYETGELAELVTKEAGKATALRLFPGAVWIERIGKGRRERQRVELVANGLVRVHAGQGWQPARPLGRRQEQIAAKGPEPLEGLTIVQDVPRVTALVSAAYRLAFSPSHGTSPLHAAELALRFDRGSLAASASVARGWRSGQFEAWGYSADRSEVALSAGPTWQLGQVRTGLAAELRGGWTTLAYQDGTSHSAFSWSTGLLADGLLQLWRGRPALFLHMRAGVGLERVGSAAAGASTAWSAIPFVALGLGGQAF